MKRGVYLMADTPPKMHALAIEGGGGDKKLLGEVLAEELTETETAELISDLTSSREGADR